MVTGVAVGDVTITASSGGFEASATITVRTQHQLLVEYLPLLTQQQRHFFSGHASDANHVDELVYTWSSTPVGVTLPQTPVQERKYRGDFPAGQYVGVSVSDPGGQVATDSVVVDVEQVLSGLSVNPSAVSIAVAAPTMFRLWH